MNGGQAVNEHTYRFQDDVDVLARAVEPHLRAGFTFANVGAHDGVVNDPCWPFIERYSWSGVCAEPDPVTFARLATNYQHLPMVELRRVAVSSEPRSLWRVIDGDFVSAQVASLDRGRVEEALSHLASIEGIEPHWPEDMPPMVALDGGRRIGEVEQVPVECVSFADLVVGRERVDLVNIDVEGADWDVLRMVDLDGLDVRVVVVESGRNDDAWAIDHRMTEHGFTRVGTFGVFSAVWTRP